MSTDDSFGKHRRLFFKSPWMLGEVNQLHFQKESFPAFTGLFFSSSTESADNLTEVILHQQTPATRPSCFFVGSVEIEWGIVLNNFGSVDNGGHSLRTEKIFVGKTSSGFPEDINREDEVTLTSVSCVQPRLNAQIY